MDKQELHDPSLEGIKGLKSVVSKTPEDKAFDQYIQSADKRLENFNTRNPFTAEGMKSINSRGLLNTQYQRNIGTPEVGQSKYDQGITSEAQVLDLNETRATLQPWYEQVTAGVAKGGVLAATTFVEGTLGLVAGLGTAIQEGKFSGVWDNPVNRAMKEVTDWSEQALPNYMTNAEKQNEESGQWYKNLFTSNFIGNNVLKNMGFMVGAGWSGALWAKGLSAALKMNQARLGIEGIVNMADDAAKLGTTSEKLAAVASGDAAIDGGLLMKKGAEAAKGLKWKNPSIQLTGSVTGAMGEASIEAINNSEEFVSKEKLNIENAIPQISEDEKSKLFEENSNYFQLTNTGTPESPQYENTLTPEGQIELGKRVNIRRNELLGKVEEERTKMGNADFLLNIPLLTMSNLVQFGRVYSGGFKSAKKALNIIGSDVEGYTAKKMGRLAKAGVMAKTAFTEGTEEMLQQSAATGAQQASASRINDFYGAKLDPDAEEKTIGLMQGIGKGIADTYTTGQGWEQFFVGALFGAMGLPGLRSSKSETGGKQLPITMNGGIWQEARDIKEEEGVTDQVVGYMNQRLQDPKTINYYQGNIRHNTLEQVKEDAATDNDEFNYKNADHSQLISDIIMFDRANRLEDLKNIIDRAGTLESDEAVEDFRENMSKGETPSIFDKMSPDDIRAHVKKQADTFKSKIDTYQKISEDLQVRAGDKFEPDELDELTWMSTSIQDWENRFQDMHKEIKADLTPIIEGIQTKAKDSGVEINEDISNLLHLNPIQLTNALSLLTSPEAAQLTDDLTVALQTSPKKVDLIAKVQDLQKLAKARLEFVTKYNDYLTKPAGLKARITAAHEKAAQKAAEKAEKSTAPVREEVAKAISYEEFVEKLDKVDKNKEEIVNSLEKSGNEYAKQYNDLLTLNNKVVLELGGEDVPSQAARIIYTNMANKSNDVKELLNVLNPNIDDLEVVQSQIPNISNEDFAQAVSLVQDAIGKVNKNHTVNKIAQKSSEKVTTNFGKTTETTPTIKEGKPISTGINFQGGSLSESEAIKVETKPIEATPIVETPEELPPPPANLVNDGNGNLTEITPEVKEEKATTPIPTVTHEVIDEPSIKTYVSNLMDTVNNKIKAVIDSTKSHTQYLKTGITEYDLAKFAATPREFVPFVQTHDGYKLIIKELEDTGAFKYVNEGNLKIGDKIGFVVKPSFNKEAGFLKNTIFLAKLDKGGNIVSVVGVLEENIPNKADVLTAYKQSVVKSLRERILQAFIDVNNPPIKKDGYYIYHKTTTVKKVNPGFIPYDTNMVPKNLQDIDGMEDYMNSTNGKEFILGLGVNGLVVTPNHNIDVVMYDKVISGMPYMVIKNADGRYYPVPVTVKHFNNEEFDINSITVQDTIIYKKILGAATKLAKAYNPKEFNTAYVELNQLLTLTGDNSGLNDIHINPNKNDATDIVFSNDRLPDSDKNKWKHIPRVKGKITGNIDKETGEVTEVDNTIPEEEVVNNIMQTLMSYNLKFQVALTGSMGINTGSVNNNLLKDNLLSTNLLKTDAVNGWFLANMLDNEDEEVIVSEENITTTRIVKPEKVETIEGESVYHNGTTYYITNAGVKDVAGNPIRDNNLNLKLRDILYIEKGLNGQLGDENKW